jgi:signal transduction histidine kinase
MTDPLDILLVEDNPGDVRLIEEMLKEADGDWHGEDEDRSGFDLVHATTLSAGLDQLESGDIELVLLDLDLPDSEGLETLERMLAAVESAPVLVFTGRPEEDLGIEAVRQGAQDYLVKGDVRVGAFAQSIKFALERTKTQQELRRRTHELAILNQLMRHDIKNDISLVIGRSHELTEYVDPRGEELLGEILTSAHHVLQLTQTIGDTIKTITREDASDLQAVDPVEMLVSEVEKAQELYGESAVTLADDLPTVEVLADELLAAVFGNLLSNALLYTPVDPKVHVGMEVGDDTVTVWVADNGPGVPDAQKQRIFGHGTSGVESHGIGIGLYLVDQLVKGYNGRVWVEDNEPTGAVFHVELDRP